MDNTTEDKIYTYADYKNYYNNKYTELIEGKVYSIDPAPSKIHDKIIVELSSIINTYMNSDDGVCKIYVVHLALFLTNAKNIENCKNVIRPDILILCDETQLNDKGCIGAPDLIIEVTSSFNPSNDYIRKLNLYDQYKVKEYWIVNPINKSILVYRLDDTMHYSAPEIYNFTNTIRVGIYDNFKIDFNTLGV